MIQELYHISGILLYFSCLCISSCAFLYFFRKRGNYRSNFFLALFFIAFGMALIRNGLILSGQIEPDNQLTSALWNIIWFGPLFFYYIKLIIYPHYLLRGSDLKHFVLPTKKEASSLPSCKVKSLQSSKLNFLGIQQPE